MCELVVSWIHDVKFQISEQMQRNVSPMIRVIAIDFEKGPLALFKIL